MKSKKHTIWFSHDADAQDDPKIMVLITQLGWDAYGLYWMLIERLCKQPGYMLPVKLIDSISRLSQTSKEKLEAIIFKFSLFETDGEDPEVANFYSPSLVNRMQLFDTKTNRMRNLALKRWYGSTDNEQDIAHAHAHAMRKQCYNITEHNIIQHNTTEENNIRKEDPETDPGSVPSPDPLLLNNDILKLFLWIEKGKLPCLHEPVFPERFLPKTEKQRKNWLQCLDKLYRIDHCTLQEINGAIIFAREDPFWKKNFLSLLKLRDKDKNGVKYIDRFVTEWEKQYRKRKPNNERYGKD